MDIKDLIENIQLTLREFTYEFESMKEAQNKELLTKFQEKLKERGENIE